MKKFFKGCLYTIGLFFACFIVHVLLLGVVASQYGEKVAIYNGSIITLVSVIFVCTIALVVRIALRTKNKK